MPSAAIAVAPRCPCFACEAGFPGECIERLQPHPISAESQAERDAEDDAAAERLERLGEAGKLP